MSAWQVTQLKIGNSNANKNSDAVTDGFEHTPDLPIDTLSQDDAQAIGRQGMETLNLGSLSV